MDKPLRYHVKAGVAAKVAKPGEKPQDYTVTHDLVFEEDELIAGHSKTSADNEAAAQWASRGYCVFKRGNWYLIVIGYEADIEF